MKFVQKVKVSRDIYYYIIIISVLLIYMFYWEFMPFRNLYDDLIAVVFWGILFIKIKSIKKNELIIIALLLCTMLIAFISNYAQGIVTNISYMLNDAFSFLRMFFVYIGTMLLVQNNSYRHKRIIESLAKIAKIFLAISFMCGCLTQIGVLDMYERIRFGIKCFTFITRNASQYGVLVGCALGFILLNEKGRTLKYEVMAIAVLIMTGKGMSFIIATVYIAMIIIKKIGFKISLMSLVVCGLLLLFVLKFQILSYIIDPAAPRAIFLKYGIITALRYFPLGAGFATFGSNMAAQHYSPLYIEYGFRNIRALAGNNDIGLAMLNDVYLGMVLGEYGVIGAVLVFIVFIMIFKKIWNKKVFFYKRKCMAVACFVCACGMAVMAGSLKNEPGEIIFLFCALFCCQQEEGQL